MFRLANEHSQQTDDESFLSKTAVGHVTVEDSEDARCLLKTPNFDQN